ncbi:class II aldolase/adducin family protein [Mesorhizobium sp. PL10]
MSAPKNDRTQSINPDVSEAERALRIDLAAAYRLADRFGWADLTSAHFSAAVPGEEGLFLVNPYPSYFHQLRASDLIKLDMDGVQVGGPPSDVNPAGFTIHSAVHMARPDVGCVMHVHTIAGMALSALDCGLLPITQHALLFHKSIGYHDYEGIADDLAERERLVADLADHKAVILRNHGFLVVGRSIPEAFKTMFYLEKAANAQLLAMAACAGGANLLQPKPEVCTKTAAQYQDFGIFGAEDWEGHLRTLDAIDPAFRH